MERLILLPSLTNVSPTAVIIITMQFVLFFKAVDTQGGLHRRLSLPSTEAS